MISLITVVLNMQRLTTLLVIREVVAAFVIRLVVARIVLLVVVVFVVVEMMLVGIGADTPGVHITIKGIRTRIHPNYRLTTPKVKTHRILVR